MTSESLSRWDDLRAAGLVRSVAAGETLFREGDPADGAYVVLAGRFAVLEGDEQLNVLNPGELFGEIGAIGSGSRSATVIALDQAELLFLSLHQLREGFAASPELFWQSLQLIVDRLRTITARQVAYRDEHKALREVQRTLLPDLGQVDTHGAFRVSALWEPCTYASGDYYDVIPIDASRHLIAVGDVMGHGAESSLMMAIARAQIRELARSFRRTDELLLNLDGYLRDNAPPKQGMSLVVAVYDRRDHVLEYSVAGHPFPLLLRETELSDLPGRPGIVLALPFLLGTGYERYETELEPGDQLLFFTDGLFEVAVDDGGKQLGRAGLSAIFAEVVTSAGGATGGDDALAELFARVSRADTSEAADDDRTALLLRLDY
ncbi:MAG: SpoIIE family protein phosphatase [Acidimicrobiales bacterium]